MRCIPGELPRKVRVELRARRRPAAAAADGREAEEAEGHLPTERGLALRVEIRILKRGGETEGGERGGNGETERDRETQ